MGLFSRKPKAEAVQVTVHIANPMSPRLRHEHEDGVEQQLLAKIAPGSSVVGGGTELSAAGDPISCDIELEVVSDDVQAVCDALAEVFTGNGVARGSWIARDDTRMPIGEQEYVLLRTQTTDDGVEWDEFTTALQGALGGGSIGYHEETYQADDGYVYVFSGPSAGSVLAALRAELPNHPAVSRPLLQSVTPGAAEA